MLNLDHLDILPEYISNEKEVNKNGFTYKVYDIEK